MSLTESPALFIDRDGVINRMVRYGERWDSPKKPEDVVLVPGIIEIIRWANKRKVPVVEISNRPEVAKGQLIMAQLQAIEDRVHQLLRQQGVGIGHKYFCYHHPRGVVAQLTGECKCRKPKPGLLLQAARELDIDLAKSVFLGDKASDVQAGQTAGCKTIIYLHDEDLPEKVKTAKAAPANYKVTQLEEAIGIVERMY